MSKQWKFNVQRQSIIMAETDDQLQLKLYKDGVFCDSCVIEDNSLKIWKWGWQTVFRVALINHDGDPAIAEVQTKIGNLRTVGEVRILFDGSIFAPS